MVLYLTCSFSAAYRAADRKGWLFMENVKDFLKRKDIVISPQRYLIEALGAMSAEDVEHVGKAIVRQMRQTLTDGNSVRLDGFGIFHTTFKCRATEVAKDCTVKNIERVNIRFKVANTLRLVNDSNATTKGGANNLVFELVSEDKNSSGGGSGNNTPGSGGSDGDQGENPLG